MAERLKLILASASPQRSNILKRLGVDFQVRATGVKELSEGDPEDVARQNALRKARAALRPQARELCLGVDTLVALDGQIYGKPTDAKHARRTLKALSAKTHLVYSALALCDGLTERVVITCTEVHFRELDDDLLDWYLDLEEWVGRAGGYAIQGTGAVLVREVHGDYENVVGLPVSALLDLHPGLLER